MKRSILTMFAVLATALLIVACGSDDDDPVDPGPTPPFNGTVSVRDNFFSPRNITISAGDSVTWSFDGSNLHTVTEGATNPNPIAIFDSGNRRSGTFGYRFTTAGSFPYHCRPHFDQGMTGSVTVE